MPSPLLVLTDRAQVRARDLVDVVAAAVTGGARALVVREKDQPEAVRRQLVEQLCALLHPVGGLVLTASPTALGGDGVHLASDDAFPVDPPPLVGRSCHDRRELWRAADEGCSYATLSPIFASPSKPGYGPPLGPAALADAPLPVFALGGVTARRARSCLNAGAAGVAVMGAVMRADDPAATVADLLGVLTGVTTR